MVLKSSALEVQMMQKSGSIGGARASGVASSGSGWAVSVLGNVEICASTDAEPTGDNRAWVDEPPISCSFITMSSLATNSSCDMGKNYWRKYMVVGGEHTCNMCPWTRSGWI